MIDREQLIVAFARNVNIVKRQTTGLTHADTLLQLPFRGNCMNWVLGHIAANQNRIAMLLGAESALDERAQSRYTTESPPVVDEDGSTLKLEELLSSLERSQEHIAAALGQASDEMLAREVGVGERTQALAARIFFLYFHECYHVGQLELLRQLAGKNDKVI